MKILLVEDNPFISENTKIILNRNYYDVDILADGDGVTEYVKSREPDLILLDVMMPGKNGYEVCKELKEDPSTRNIPLILMSAKTQPDEIKDGLNQGADGYLTKPCRSDDLIKTVKEFLENSSNRKR